MQFRTVADLNSCIVKNLELVPGDVDLIVGLPRSGMLPATLLALHLNLPMTDWESFLKGHIMPVGRTRQNDKQVTDISQCRKVFVIDDTISTGKTIKKAREQALISHLNQEIIWASVYAIPGAEKKVDCYFETCPLPQIFEWNLLHQAELKNCCVDIDGVLCRNPTAVEDDDGPAYVHFLQSVPPKIVPNELVGYLVTARLEKYRHETETWLRKHGVNYKKLIMMDLPDKEARTAAGSHAIYKADIYKKTNTHLFIESNSKQAIEISSRTNKPVYCFEKHQFIPSSGFVEGKNLARYKVKSSWKLIKKRLSKLKKKLKHKLKL